MSVPYGKARRLAKSHLKDIFNTYFNTEVAAALAGDSWGASPSLPGLAGVEAIKRVFPDAEEAVPLNFGVYLYIVEDGPRTVTRTNSESVSIHKVTTYQDFSIVVLFEEHVAAVKEEDEFGATPDTDEVMVHRGDLYIEAISNVMFKHGIKQGFISDIEPVDDLPVTYPTDKFPILGSAAMRWRIHQITQAPNPICNP